MIGDGIVCDGMGCDAMGCDVKYTERQREGWQRRKKNVGR